jgi:DNA-binding NarL/FixJ family response regulator
LAFYLPMTGSPKIKILLIDDHQLFNDGIKSLLSNEQNIQIVGQLFEARSILFEIQKLRPDLLFLDINLPDKNGLLVAEEVFRNFPDIKIILLTMYAENQVIKDAMKIGVQGYILKNSSKSELLEGIKAVYEGGKYIDPKAKLTEELSSNKNFGLSAREKEIIYCIKDGMDSYQIADKVCLSYLTVKTHRRNIHFKLGTKTTSELIKFAIDNNL